MYQASVSLAKSKAALKSRSRLKFGNKNVGIRLLGVVDEKQKLKMLINEMKKTGRFH